MDKQDFRGPVGRAEEITSAVMDAGILLQMRVRCPGLSEQDPLSREAVVVPGALVTGLCEELPTALDQWLEFSRGRR